VFCALLAAAPAVAERKTEMVDEGKPVDSLLMRYAFDASWVLNPQSILMRDSYRDHYLLTLSEPCEWIELSNPFFFFPKLSDRVRTELRYEVRDNLHKNCDISRIEKVDRIIAKDLIANLAEK
jgi:hypothetical protein